VRWQHRIASKVLALGAASAMLWIGVIGGSLWWNIRQIDQTTMHLAESEVRSNFEKDLLYRQWAARHGGIYVPASEWSPPNPYLSHLPDRDVMTDQGVQLTLINPAYMTRQVYEMAREKSGTQGHITSLKPLRPANAPDEWETDALQQFERGVQEVAGIETMNGQPHLRLMRPVIAEQSCLACHGDQGYREGDIRGGISVSVPFAHYTEAAAKSRAKIVGAHTVVGSLGMIGIGLSTFLISRSEHRLIRSETRLRTLYESSSEAVMMLDRNGFIQCNPQTLSLFGIESVGTFSKLHPADLSPPQQADSTDSMAAAQEKIDSATREGRVRFEWLHKRFDTDEVFPAEVFLTRMELDGKQVLQASVRDITEHKRAERRLRKRTAELEDIRRVLTDQSELLDQAMVTGAMGAWSFDVATQMFTFTDAFYAIFRTTAEAEGGHQMSLARYAERFIPAEFRQVVADETRAALRSEDRNYRRMLDHQVVFADGSPGWIQVSFRRVSDSDGNPVRLIGVNQDITERKEVEEELRRTFEATERINRLMTDREDRVLELKDEVNALLGQLGRDVKYRSAARGGTGADAEAA
jgi:PAS domain S-box-containing protein